MSAFEELLAIAHDAGHTRLDFSVDLRAHFERRDDAWWVRSGEGPHIRGRTGQAALAELLVKGTDEE